MSSINNVPKFVPFKYTNRHSNITAVFFRLLVVLPLYASYQRNMQPSPDSIFVRYRLRKQEQNRRAMGISVDSSSVSLASPSYNRACLIFTQHMDLPSVVPIETDPAQALDLSPNLNINTITAAALSSIDVDKAALPLPQLPSVSTPHDSNLTHPTENYYTSMLDVVRDPPPFIIWPRKRIEERFNKIREEQNKLDLEKEAAPTKKK